MTDIFPILIINGRPAAGKSEVIHFLQQLPADVRAEQFHIGQLTELDDFPMLWTWFEEDHLLEHTFGRPRLHTDSEGYFIHNDLWHLLIERLSLDYRKLQRDTPDLHQTHTVLIEFSRGTEHGGYRQAYPHLSDEILRNPAARTAAALTRTGQTASWNTVCRTRNLNDCIKRLTGRKLPAPTQKQSR